MQSAMWLRNPSRATHSAWSVFWSTTNGTAGNRLGLGPLVNVVAAPDSARPVSRPELASKLMLANSKRLALLAREAMTALGSLDREPERIAADLRGRLRASRLSIVCCCN